MNKFHGNLDQETMGLIVERGIEAELFKLRSELIERKKVVESQLADDTAAFRDERAELLEKGVHPREAEMRASSAGDPDWRTRASGYVRICDLWLGKIRAKLAEKATLPTKDLGAVVIEGAGKSAQHAATALNSILRHGCSIFSATVIGTDLVVIASAPKGERIPVPSTEPSKSDAEPRTIFDRVKANERTQRRTKQA